MANCGIAAPVVAANEQMGDARQDRPDMVADAGEGNWGNAKFHSSIPGEVEEQRQHK